MKIFLAVLLCYVHGFGKRKRKRKHNIACRAFCLLHDFNRISLLFIIIGYVTVHCAMVSFSFIAQVSRLDQESKGRLEFDGLSSIGRHNN